MKSTESIGRICGTALDSVSYRVRGSGAIAHPGFVAPGSACHGRNRAPPLLWTLGAAIPSSSSAAPRNFFARKGAATGVRQLAPRVFAAFAASRGFTQKIAP